MLLYAAFQCILPTFGGTMKKSVFVMFVLVVSASCFAASPESSPKSITRLSEKWALQSSAKVSETGDAISTAGYTSKDWYPTSVPSTVVAALVRNHVYPDPYFGMNLRSMPGVSYPIGQNFSNVNMPADSPFRVSWWYRTEFTLPKVGKGQHLWLHFDGINYRANVWLNGRQIAKSDELVGTWRLFEFDITEATRAGTRTRWRWKYFRRRRTTSRSPGWTGTRCRPTKSWAFGAMFTSPPAAP